MPFDPTILINDSVESRYKKQLDRIFGKLGYIRNIEETVNNAINNIEWGCKSFVIYGEPQSGKTEMMIALTARLLDYGKKIIIILLNDNVQLLNQNLDRFQRSKINPTPKVFSEFISQTVDLKNSVRVIFSKKNSRDLQKLIELVSSLGSKAIIDDEADYASPNSKINQEEKTKINELVEALIGEEGVYIGVTATPARLDLNNTFNNNNTKWICFSPPPNYHGQEHFFPDNYKKSKLIKRLPSAGDSRKFLTDALFGFLINNAYLNLQKKTAYETNYCMLIHTSGKKHDHEVDQENIEEILDILGHKGHKKFLSYFEEIWKLATKKFSEDTELVNRIVQFISRNINRSQVIVINSEHDKERVKCATSPSALFTIAIGGNIVSRGVTFENLLTMFFTRDAKHKIQQDTYIQRARMFGYRGDYLDYFELHVPEKLYLDWYRCFMYHRLSLGLIRSGHGAPLWLEDRRISAVAKSSIDRSTIVLYDESMSFGLFKYNNQIEDVISNNSLSKIEKLSRLHELIGEQSFPSSVIEFIKKTVRYDELEEIAVHNSSPIEWRDVDPEMIVRFGGGIFSGADYKKYPAATHHIKVFYILGGNARVYYRYRQDPIISLLSRNKING